MTPSQHATEAEECLTAAHRMLDAVKRDLARPVAPSHFQVEASVGIINIQVAMAQVHATLATRSA